MSQRFSVAVHILALLASEPSKLLTSEWIASSVNTNAVVVRRLLGLLRRAGWVKTRAGREGGFELAVDPSALTLREVYQAVEEGRIIGIHAAPNPRCPVGSCIGAALGSVVASAQEAMLAELGKRSLADVVKELSVRRERKG
ncbi:MAG TPA: Rrf2 family transcriptional regulator [Thermoanaerobaculia bacterium]|nr:Rrf2 family transcriptional regulator [Thermoanaerobaculia bacterium]